MRTPHRLATLPMKVATTFVRRVVVLVRSLADESHDFPLPRELRLAVLDRASDLTAYRRFRPDQEPALLDGRLARGDLCFAVLDGERLAHATWASASRGPLPYLDADVALGHGDVCLYDSFTDHAWRGRGLSRCRDELCRRHYRAAGMRRTLALIARENAAGLRTAAPLGYRPIGEYGLLRLGPLRHRWSTSYGADLLPPLVARVRPQRGATA